MNLQSAVIMLQYTGILDKRHYYDESDLKMTAKIMKTSKGNTKQSPAKKRARSSSIHESQVMFDNLSEFAPYPLFLINPDTSIRYVNPAFVELTGYTKEELVGCKPPYPWWNGEVETKTGELIANLEGHSKIERCNIARNGKRFWVQATGKPVFLNGKLEYYLSNWVDITERKKAEQKLSKLNKELRQLTAHMDSIREEERGNISRIIHDELGQALTSLKMDVCWIQKNLSDNQPATIQLTDSMLKMIDATFQKIRWISTVLRPIWLDDLGLPDTMKWLAEEFQQMSGIKCRITVGKNLRINKQISTTIYRIFQEALTNIFRHSKASQVKIILKSEKDNLVLIIFDNGKGIPAPLISSHRSYGILGMRERAQYVGGTFGITSGKNKGTMIKVLFPNGKGG
jgi:PAS domain S-box-containing protein